MVPRLQAYYQQKPAQILRNEPVSVKVLNSPLKYHLPPFDTACLKPPFFFILQGFQDFFKGINRHRAGLRPAKNIRISGSAFHAHILAGRKRKRSAECKHSPIFSLWPWCLKLCPKGFEGRIDTKKPLNHAGFSNPECETCDTFWGEYQTEFRIA